ncbi:MAG: protoporphyrinogen oxidase [Candidatus Magnetoovum sp. WYHC-5]|nr:protoporphyrinogen oxidase [Candidatus Magnetoovum sp. WYHC-5]
MEIAIIGGGISGLSLAYYLKTISPSLYVTVYESSNRPGGKIWTTSKNGFLIETSVNGFLDNRPETLRLASLLGLTPLKSNDASKLRYVLSGGKLHQLPDSPVKFFRSPLLSVRGRLRLALEIFISGKHNNDEETLEEFAVRRLGREAFEKLIDPMANGIFAGDPSLLELKSAFPRIYNLEKKHASLIRGMFKMKLQARKTKQTVSAGPGGTLTSFKNGMQDLINALQGKLSAFIKTNHKLNTINAENGSYVLNFENGKTVKAKTVVIATPAHEAATIFSELDSEIAYLLTLIPYPPVDVACMGFKEDALKKPFRGFGFLVPGKEKRKTLGTLNDSNVFTGRAPDNHILLRTMVGGQRFIDSRELSDDAIRKIVIEELDQLFGLNDGPVLFELFRHRKAIPQYNRGHSSLLARLQANIAKYPSLYLHGNSYRGISVNDCIERSQELSERLFANSK